MMRVCDFVTKLVAMATYLEMSEKEVQVNHLHPKCFHSIAKIGPVDPAIIVLQAIVKKDITRKCVAKPSV